MRKMFFIPDDPSPLSNGLTEDHNGWRLCTNQDYGVYKHVENLSGALLYNHAYLNLTRSGLLHTFPIFKYKGFVTEKIYGKR